MLLGQTRVLHLIEALIEAVKTTCVMMLPTRGITDENSPIYRIILVMLRRLISGFSANVFGQAVNIVIQLFSLPLFLLYWDTSTYGSWLILSAVPAYLSMADLGMVSVSGNKMTMALGRSDVAEANRVFQSANLFLIIVCGSLALLVTPLALWAPLPWPLFLDERVALAALFCQVLLALFGGLSDAAFKATGRYAIGTMLSNLGRLGEWAGAIVGLVLFRSFTGVAICGFVARAAGTGMSIWLSQTGDHGVLWGIKLAQKTEIMALIRPAVYFLAFPLANAFSFQGVTLVVGALFGPATVTIFTSYRTISRIAVQLTGMFSLTLWPEFGRLFGHGGPRAIEKLFRYSALLGAIQALALSVLLYFVSPWLLRVWTHGRIEFVPSLMVWMLAYAAISGLWHVPRVLLLSTNQHIGLAGWSLAAGGLSVTLAWVFGREWQLEGVSAAMLTSECLIAFVCNYLALRLFMPTPSLKGFSS
jgi:O-antigen/teichoic acid export membrane protein